MSDIIPPVRMGYSYDEVSIMDTPIIGQTVLNRSIISSNAPQNTDQLWIKPNNGLYENKVFVNGDWVNCGIGAAVYGQVNYLQRTGSTINKVDFDINAAILHIKPYNQIFNVYFLGKEFYETGGKSGTPVGMGGLVSPPTSDNCVTLNSATVQAIPIIPIFDKKCGSQVSKVRLINLDTKQYTAIFNLDYGSIAELIMGKIIPNIYDTNECTVYNGDDTKVMIPIILPSIPNPLVTIAPQSIVEVEINTLDNMLPKEYEDLQMHDDLGVKLMQTYLKTTTISIAG